MRSFCKQFAMVCVILTFLSGLVYSQDKRPKWIDQIPGNPDLLQGIGVADDTGSPETDQKRADASAASQIINEISTTVSNSLADYYQESSERSSPDRQRLVAEFSFFQKRPPISRL